MRTSWCWVGMGLVVASCYSPPEAEEPKPAASAAGLRFECEANGLRAYDPSRSLLVGPRMNCTVLVADRAGAALADVQVTLLSEAGRMLSSGPTDASGARLAVHEVAEPLPRDVEPGAFVARPGEPIAPAFMQPERWVEDPRIPLMPTTITGAEPRRPDPTRRGPNGPLLNNPRDNLVTLVAVVEGEEAFVDSNGNGAFDPGEPFSDLAEPFVDTNDDGTRDDREDFIDANGNRQWDGPNGTWDARTQIWRQTRILWTGLPSANDVVNSVPGVQGHRSTFVPFIARLRCSDASCATVTPATGRLFLADPWFNALTHLSSGDRCEPTDSPSPVTIAPGAALGPQVTWGAGEWFDFTITKKPNAVLPTNSFPGTTLSAYVRCRFTATPSGETADGLSFAIAVSVE